MKNNRILVFLVVIVMLVGLGVGCSNDEKTEVADPVEVAEESKGEVAEEIGDVIVMKLANANPSGDIKDQVSLKFAELVSEKTNGKVEIQVYSGGSLGDWRDAIEGLSMGINEIVIEGLSSCQSQTDLANIDGLPYLYRDAQHYLDVMSGDVGEELIEAIGKDGNFKILAPQYRGARITTSNVRFTNLEELKGLKIRVPNVESYLKTWQYLGTTPTPLALTETFTAIQQGTVDAQENPIIESYGFAFYDVCDYLVRTNHVYGTDVFYFDLEYFENLTPEIQKAIEEAADEAGEWRTKEVLKLEEEYLQKFKDEGVEIVDADIEELTSAVDGLVEEDFPYLKDWVEKMKAVQ